tara:strand:- start:733 stop:1860 length:1128 start_codon:yes stop_codon:yes gene_type:complete
MFDPLYYAPSSGIDEISQLTIFAGSGQSTTNVSISNGTGGNQEALINFEGKVKNDNANPAIFQSNSTTKISFNSAPHYDSIIILTGSISFSPSNGYTNIEESSESPTGFSIKTQYKKRADTSYNDIGSKSTNYHQQGTFGQTAASGSLAFYGGSQGYDTSTLTGTSETFTGEKYRIQINGNCLSGSYDDGDKFTTSSYVVNNLQQYDLQVKPGYLVRPGSSKGYWIVDPDNSKDYKFYARAFKDSSGITRASIDIDVDKTLVNWDSTSDGVAVALLLQSAGASNFSTPTIFDISFIAGGNVIASDQSQNDQLNPFSSNIDILGNTNGGSITSTSYNVPLISALNMNLDSSNPNIIILIRYKGDSHSVQNISITYN